MVASQSAEPAPVHLSADRDSHNEEVSYLLELCPNQTFFAEVPVQVMLARREVNLERFSGIAGKLWDKFVVRERGCERRESCSGRLKLSSQNGKDCVLRQSRLLLR